MFDSMLSEKAMLLAMVIAFTSMSEIQTCDIWRVEADKTFKSDGSLLNQCVFVTPITAGFPTNISNETEYLRFVAIQYLNF